MNSTQPAKGFVPSWLVGWSPPGSFDETVGVFLGDSREVASFPEEGIDLFGDVDDESFWFEHRSKIILELTARYAGTPSTVLEVGSGSGTVAASLALAGHRVMAVEPNVGGAARARKRGVPVAFEGTLSEARLSTASFDVVGLFDVIEHLDRWKRVLEEAHRVLRPSGHLLVTVPAYQWLWSEHDDWNEHKRRYSVARLEADLLAAGFTVERSGPFFAPLVPPAILRHLAYKAGRRSSGGHEERLRAQLQPSPVINGALSRMLGLERWLMDRMALPFGTSLFAVAKPSDEVVT